MMKRLFDIMVSLAGLAIASPIMLAIAILIKIESRGPIFYSCQRMGRNRKPFGMLKFRTMLQNADSVDCKLCVSKDVRVTPLGRFLRKTKFNELPQLFNVLIGDMSVVGPRPEDLQFTEHYKELWDVVLSVRPAVVGPNQITNRNEEDMFPPEADPALFYLEHILPEKLERDVSYVKNQTLWGDIVLLSHGVYVTIFKGSSANGILDHPEVVKQLLLDSCLSAAAYLLANILRYESVPQDLCILVNVIVILSVNPILFYTLGLYNCSVRFFSVPDLFQVLKISGVAGAFQVLANYFILVGGGHSRTVFILYPMILAGLLCSKRIIDRIVWERRELRQTGGLHVKRVAVYGAGRRGAEAVKRLQFETGQDVVGLLDDDTHKRNSTVLGVRVLGTGADLPFLKSLYGIERVVIAFSPETPDESARICSLVKKAGIDDVLIRPTDMESHENLPKLGPQFRQVTFSDVLGLPLIAVSHDSKHNALQDATVAVFGAGDEFGIELCRELVAEKVGRIIVVEDCEARLEKVACFLKSLPPNGTSFTPIFQPPSMPRLIQDHLERPPTKWIIYNPFNRPFDEALSSLPTRAFFGIVDAVQVIELAKLLRCECFTFLSPSAKEGFSPSQRQLHLLVEDLTRFTARENPSTTRFITLRPANVLENENEVFLKTCSRNSSRPLSEKYPNAVNLTSAVNAARVVINSFFPDYSLIRGRILVDGSGLICDMGALVDRFGLFQGNGSSPKDNRSVRDGSSVWKKLVDPSAGLAGEGARMVAPGILMPADGEHIDEEEMRRVKELALSVRHHQNCPTVDEFRERLGPVWNRLNCDREPNAASTPRTGMMPEKTDWGSDRPSQSRAPERSLMRKKHSDAA